MKVIIAGGRTFNDYNLMLNSVFVNDSEIKTIQEVVSGTAGGADRLGERLAKEHGYKLTQFPANWDKFGKSAGYKRNEEMAKYADALIAFWDGQSKGTKHMIDLAKKHNLKIMVINY